MTLLQIDGRSLGRHCHPNPGLPEVSSSAPCTSIVPFLLALFSVPFWTLASPTSEFAAPCTPGAQFQLLKKSGLHTRSLLSATCTTSGTEENLRLSVQHWAPLGQPDNQNVEKLIEPAISSMALHSLPLSPPDHRPLCGKHPEWRSLRRARSSSLRPRRNPCLLIMHREPRSSVVGRFLAVSKPRNPERMSVHPLLGR